MSRLLLISSSRVHGSGWLEKCAGDIDAFLGAGGRRALFVPYAVADHPGLAQNVREKLGPLGIELDSLHEARTGMDARAAIEKAAALVVSGGNTFRLLAALHAMSLIEPIARRVATGMPYVGWSAGAVIACPTIRTTNDMPIVEPPTLRALGFVPFQINAHYVDADPDSKHMGETREQRIAEFLEENDLPVVGLREGAILRREEGSLRLEGVAGAKVFRRGQTPTEFALGATLDDLLA